MGRLDDYKKEVYSVVAAIPRGRVLSYGQIAWVVGLPGQARWVGRTLRDAPRQLALPCHRVVNGQGRTVPGWGRQAELLRAEGVRFRPNGCVDMASVCWNFDE